MDGLLGSPAPRVHPSLVGSKDFSAVRPRDLSWFRSRVLDVSRLVVWYRCWVLEFGCGASDLQRVG